MGTKIKLSINLIDKKDKFYASITYLDIDDRFCVSNSPKILSYVSSKTKMEIKTSRYSSFGAIDKKCITTPNLDRMGYEISYAFLTDKDRYDFLKDFYTTLDEWSNFWDDFYMDSNSHMEVRGKVWEIKYRKFNKK